MTPSPDPKPVFTALTALIEAFTKLDPLLSYGGLILVGATLLAWLTGQLPDWLLAVPLVVIGAFLLYSYLDRRAETEKIRIQQEAEREKLRLQHEAELEKARLNQELEKQRLEIERLKVEQKGKLEQTRQEQKGNPPPPKPVAPDPEPSPATWPQSYYRAVWQKCLQMQMTGIDPKAQELGAAVFQLHKIFTSLDVPAGTQHNSNHFQRVLTIWGGNHPFILPSTKPLLMLPLPTPWPTNPILLFMRPTEAKVGNRWKKRSIT